MERNSVISDALVAKTYDQLLKQALRSLKIEPSRKNVEELHTRVSAHCNGNSLQTDLPVEIERFNVKHATKVKNTLRKLGENFSKSELLRAYFVQKDENEEEKDEDEQSPSSLDIFAEQVFCDAGLIKAISAQGIELTAEHVNQIILAYRSLTIAQNEYLHELTACAVAEVAAKHEIEISDLDRNTKNLLSDLICGKLLEKAFEKSGIEKEVSKIEKEGEVSENEKVVEGEETPNVPEKVEETKKAEVKLAEKSVEHKEAQLKKLILEGAKGKQIFEEILEKSETARKAGLDVLEKYLIGVDKDNVELREKKIKVKRKGTNVSTDKWGFILKININEKHENMISKKISQFRQDLKRLDAKDSLENDQLNYFKFLRENHFRQYQDWELVELFSRFMEAKSRVLHKQAKVKDVHERIVRQIPLRSECVRTERFWRDEDEMKIVLEEMIEIPGVFPDGFNKNFMEDTFHEMRRHKSGIWKGGANVDAYAEAGEFTLYKEDDPTVEDKLEKLNEMEGLIIPYQQMCFEDMKNMEHAHQDEYKWNTFVDPSGCAPLVCGAYAMWPKDKPESEKLSWTGVTEDVPPDECDYFDTFLKPQKKQFDKAVNFDWIVMTPPWKTKEWGHGYFTIRHLNNMKPRLKKAQRRGFLVIVVPNAFVQEVCDILCGPWTSKRKLEKNKGLRAKLQDDFFYQYCDSLDAHVLDWNGCPADIFHDYEWEPKENRDRLTKNLPKGEWTTLGDKEVSIPPDNGTSVEKEALNSALPYVTFRALLFKRKPDKGKAQKFHGPLKFVNQVISDSPNFRLSIDHSTGLHHLNYEFFYQMQDNMCSSLHLESDMCCNLHLWSPKIIHHANWSGVHYDPSNEEAGGSYYELGDKIDPLKFGTKRPRSGWKEKPDRFCESYLEWYKKFDWKGKSYLQPKAFLADWTAYDSSGDDERDSEYVVQNMYGREHFPPRHPDAQRGWDEYEAEKRRERGDEEGEEVEEKKKELEEPKRAEKRERRKAKKRPPKGRERRCRRKRRLDD